MENRPLSLKEIAVIIKTCGSNQVASLKYAGLELSFHPAEQGNGILQTPHIIHRQVETKSPRTVVTGGEELPVESEVERLQRLEAFEKEQELINEPEAYEESMIEDAIQGA